MGLLLSWGGTVSVLLIVQESYSWTVLLHHLLWVAAIGKVVRWTKDRYLLVGRLMMSLSLIGLSLVYCYAVFSNHLWGKYMSFRMIGMSWMAGESLREGILLCDSWIYLAAMWIIGLAGILLWGCWTETWARSKWQSAAWNWGWGIAAMGLLPWGYAAGEPLSNTVKARVYPASPETIHIFRSAVEDAKIRLHYPSQQTIDQKHIILIMVDALRADHMSAFGYDRTTTPFLDSLLQEGNLQRVAWTFSSCSFSPCGVASSLSSRTTSELGFSHFSLHHLLKQQGYDVSFFLSGHQQAYYFLDHAHAGSIDRFQDGSSTGRGFDDRLVLDALDQFSQELSVGEPAQFLYLHLMSAHMYGEDDSAYQLYRPVPVEQDWRSSERLPLEDSLAIINGYDNGIRQADAYIEAIWQQLTALELLDNALVMITADHGEGLGEYDYYGHGNHLFPGSVQIPLLIYDTDSTSCQNLFFARQVDIAATIVDRLGLPIPANWEGTSLFQTPADENIALIRTLHKPGWCSSVVQQDSTIVQYILHEESGEEYEIHLLGQGEEGRNCCVCQ